MVRKAIIEILLVPESLDKSHNEIKEEILKELRDNFFVIPYCGRIEKITLVDSRAHKQ